MSHTRACRRTLEVISAMVVPAWALAPCAEATRIVSAAGILSLTSVRGPALREWGCPQGGVPVPFSCCDTDARADHSRDCAPLQRCLVSSPLWLICCSWASRVFSARLLKTVSCKQCLRSQFSLLWVGDGALQPGCRVMPTPVPPARLQGIVGQWSRAVFWGLGHFVQELSQKS